MTWLLDLPTRTKLFIAFGSMVALLAGVIWIAQAGIIRLQASQHAVFERDFAVAAAITELRADQNWARAQMLQMQLETQRTAHEAIAQNIEAITTENDERLARLRALNSDDPAFLARIDEIRSARAAQIRARAEQIALLLTGRSEEARQLGLGEQEARFEHIRKLSLELADEARQRASRAIADTDAQVSRATRLFGVLAVLAVLLGLMLTIVLHRVIAYPLQEITERATRIAAGDVEVQPVLPDPRTDEIGLLEANFNRMAESLRNKAAAARRIATGDLTVPVQPQSESDALGHAFAEMIDNLREINRQIGDSVNVLASSASEILAGTTQIASGVSETATATAQTATTVEEVKQTANMASQKAKSVSEMAQQAAQVSHSGRQAVEESTEGMQRIREQMEQIADSIMRLSEQTQAIGEIIATVNDLAEQSNLLAVNASIEAAKAGEHGRGFAVVAQEVKSLAAQSRQATAQVRALLGDIQKATSGAVLATEQGSKAVEAGVRQSGAAGDAIRQLTDSIAASAQAASQIAVSAQQQLAGMDQLAMATENIKLAASQNLDSTRQAELAAHNLNELGQRLKALVGRYRL